MEDFERAVFTSPKEKPFYIHVMFQGVRLPSVKRHPMLKSEGSLVGYPDKKGCFTIEHLGDRRVGVTFYTSITPMELTKDTPYAVYEEYTTDSGWGFSALWKLVELLGDDNEIEHFISAACPKAEKDTTG